MPSGLDPLIIGPALLAGLLVSATHVPLGRHVLRRGIVFIDLALAQVAGLGVIVAASAGWVASGVATQLTAIGAALAGALLLIWTERRWPSVQEALIGVLFVLAASVELLVLADNPHGGEHLKDMLVGQILWVLPGSLLPIAALYAIVLTLWFWPGLRERRGVFYALFAVTVTQSVQLVGIYLVFATLILPALSALAYADRRPLVAGYVTAVAGYASGILMSSLLDLPTGPAIVCALAVAAAAVSAIGRLRSPP